MRALDPTIVGELASLFIKCPPNAHVLFVLWKVRDVATSQRQGNAASLLSRTLRLLYQSRTFSFSSASLTGLLVLGVGKGGSDALVFDMVDRWGGCRR